MKLFFAIFLLSFSLVVSAHAAGDPVKGKTLFRSCAACHTVTGQNKSGPHLDSIAGRTAGKAEGYKYSDALANSGIVWTEQTLDAFLAAPTKLVPRSKMTVRISKAQDRADIITYLMTLPVQ